MNSAKNQRFIHERQIDSLMRYAGENFPSCVAAVLADPHGFLVAGHKKQGINVSEELLALQAVSEESLINLGDFQQYRQQLSKELNLLLIARKDRNNATNYDRLMTILKRSSVF